MTTSNEQAYAWIWLQGETQPIVAGQLEAAGSKLHFSYNQSYLKRKSPSSPSIAIYGPELALQSGRLPLLEDLHLPSCNGDNNLSQLINCITACHHFMLDQKTAFEIIDFLSA